MTNRILAKPIEMISQLPTKHVMLLGSFTYFTGNEEKDSAWYQDSVDLAKSLRRNSSVAEDVDHSDSRKGLSGYIEILERFVIDTSRRCCCWASSRLSGVSSIPSIWVPFD